MSNKITKLKAIVIYSSKQGVSLEVRMKNGTPWLSQAQISDLYGRDRTVITKHIRSIFKDQEVNEKSNVQKMHNAKSDKPVALYSLDIVLAVGYRTNSVQAIQFRKWATSVLRKYLIDGYAINERRLEEVKKNFADLQSTIKFLSTKLSSEGLKGREQEIFSILADFSKTFTILEQYDKGMLKVIKGTKSYYTLKYEEALSLLADVRKKLVSEGEAGDLFASERDKSFHGLIGALYQTFGGKELYKSVEYKAAHLLYFTIKDHPFIDGNKRSAAFLFVYFLDRNKYLYKKFGEKKINDNALAALALLVAESDPKEKDVMIKLIVNLITD